MAERVVLSDNMLGQTAMALDASAVAKYEDTTDGDTTHDCCCPCDPYPECLHGLAAASVITATTLEWDWPDGVTTARVECVGKGGDGGAVGAGGEKAGGGGGGARAIADVATPAGGVMDVYVTASAAEVWTDTGTTLAAKAVAGADGNDGDAGGVGGAGGSIIFCVGDLFWGGGNGEDGDQNDGLYHGGGGGSGGTAEDGVNGNLAEGGRGGEDQDGGGNGGDATQDGDDDGGGGGGGGGTGGRSVVRVRAWTPAELAIVFANSLNEEIHFECDGTNGAAQHIRYFLNALDGNQFTLTQTAIGSATFQWSASGLSGTDNCEGLDSSNAVRTYSWNNCTCEEPDWEDEVSPCSVDEDWVVGISVDIECMDGQQQISSVGLTICNRYRYQTWNGSEWEWTPWGFFNRYGWPHLYMGSVVQAVQPCSDDSMVRQLLWSVPQDDGTWDADNPEVGTITAVLVL